MYQFEDAFATEEDVATLMPGCWLNDAVINFYMAYAEKSFDDPRCAFVSPSVVQLVHLSNDDGLNSALVGHLSSKSFAFLPVNNASSSAALAGTHWSLLVCDVSARRFLHFDSMNHMNRSPAERIASSIASCLWGRRSSAPVIMSASPQQRNNSDCGIFVVEFIEQIARQIKDDKRDLAVSDGTLSSADRRKWLFDIIRQFPCTKHEK